MGKIEFISGEASGLFCSFYIYIDGEQVTTLKQNSSITIDLKKRKACISN